MYGRVPGGHSRKKADLGIDGEGPDAEGPEAEMPFAFKCKIRIVILPL